MYSPATLTLKCLHCQPTMPSSVARSEPTPSPALSRVLVSRELVGREVLLTYSRAAPEALLATA
jgi:hypothetical protein